MRRRAGRVRGGGPFSRSSSTPLSSSPRRCRACWSALSPRRSLRSGSVRFFFLRRESRMGRETRDQRKRRRPRWPRSRSRRAASCSCPRTAAPSPCFTLKVCTVTARRQSLHSLTCRALQTPPRSSAAFAPCGRALSRRCGRRCGRGWRRRQCTRSMRHPQAWEGDAAGRTIPSPETRADEKKRSGSSAACSCPALIRRSAAVGRRGRARSQSTTTRRLSTLSPASLGGLSTAFSRSSTPRPSASAALPHPLPPSPLARPLALPLRNKQGV